LVLENIQTFKVKTIEYVDDEYKSNNMEPVMETVGEILGDMPLMQAELLVISEEPIENLPNNITVDNKKLSGESNTVVFIGANLLKRADVSICKISQNITLCTTYWNCFIPYFLNEQVLQQGISTLRDKCFIISREKDRPDPKRFSDKYDVITIHDTGLEYIVLLRKRVGARPAKFVKILTTDLSFSWIDKVKEELKEGHKVVLYNQDEHINGLLGLVNCLRREPGGEIVYGMLIADPSAPPFNPDLEMYEEQLDKDLAINIFQDVSTITYIHTARALSPEG
jgi:fatty acid synthase, animal type